MDALNVLPDDVFQLVISAFCGPYDGVPCFWSVKGLACSKALLQRLHRLQPLVGVRSLAVVQRPAHGPWRVVLLHQGKLTKAVLKQARQGRVRAVTIMGCDVGGQFHLGPRIARLVVPELLGAGCSLIEFTVSGVKLNSTWASIFGEAAVCSTVLRRLHLVNCKLRGPLPELRLPALQKLNLSSNFLSGGLEPLQSCTALRGLHLHSNKLSGGLEALRNCTALQNVNLERNHKLTGGIEPLRGCVALQTLELYCNKLSGGLEPLRGCTKLQKLTLYFNHFTGSLEALRSCSALQALDLCHNKFTGDLAPLRDCTALQLLYLQHNQLSPTEEDKAHFEKQCPTFSRTYSI